MLDDTAKDDSEDSVQRHRRASLANQLSGYKLQHLRRLALELEGLEERSKGCVLRFIL